MNLLLVMKQFNDFNLLLSRLYFISLVSMDSKKKKWLLKVYEIILFVKLFAMMMLPYKYRFCYCCYSSGLLFQRKSV